MLSINNEWDTQGMPVPSIERAAAAIMTKHLYINSVTLKKNCEKKVEKKVTHWYIDNDLSIAQAEQSNVCARQSMDCLV